jgi:cytochrome b subunit of formate dehydrogenase
MEEKLEYWALLWGTLLMIITGVIMWFPTLATSVLPGDVIPISRALHGWEAILAILAILTWHMYHTVIKEQNRSIFTGTMTEAEMQHGHPLEYRRILAAHQYLQKMASQKKTKEDNLAHSEIVSKETRHEVV